MSKFFVCCRYQGCVFIVWKFNIIFASWLSFLCRFELEADHKVLHNHSTRFHRTCLLSAVKFYYYRKVYSCGFFFSTSPNFCSANFVAHKNLVYHYFWFNASTFIIKNFEIEVCREANHCLSAVTGDKKGMFCSNFNCYYSNILPENIKIHKEWTIFDIYQKNTPIFNQIKTVARFQAGKQSLQSTTFNYYHRNILFFSYFYAKQTHTLTQMHVSPDSTIFFHHHHMF